MGHCAPSIMQAMLDVSETDAEWLVKLVAALPGGIANTGGKCGGVTAPLVLLGLRYGQERVVQGVPVVVYKGHDPLWRFTSCQGATACRDIRDDARVPVRCIGVSSGRRPFCAQRAWAPTARPPSPLCSRKRSVASTIAGVQHYIDGGGTARCSAIAQSVARRVLSMIQPADTTK